MRLYVLVITGAVMLVVGAVLLYTHDPSVTVLSPKCVMLMLTGYKCPGCGMQRMIYHFMHGEVLTAIRYNYFATLVLFIVALWAVCKLSGNSVCVKVRNALTSRTSAYAYIGLYFFWWIFRNIADL